MQVVVDVKVRDREALIEAVRDQCAYGTDTPQHEELKALDDGALVCEYFRAVLGSNSDFDNADLEMKIQLAT